MNNTRTTNVECCDCGKKFYRRPNEIFKRKTIGNIRCVDCYRLVQITSQIKSICIVCKKEFIYKTYETKNKDGIRKTCSRSCSNINRAGTKYRQKCANKSEYNIRLLMNAFDFKSCMFQGCEYNKTYDVHRLIPGKSGGEYILGNMFAICPNHHAEIHRNIINVEKINDYTLKATYRSK